MKPLVRAAAALWLAAGASVALAQGRGYEHERHGLPPTGFVAPGTATPAAEGGGSPADAAKKAQALNGGGRVLSVDPQADGWRVKLLKDGVVRVVNVPR